MAGITSVCGSIGAGTAAVAGPIVGAAVGGGCGLAATVYITPYLVSMTDGAVGWSIDKIAEFC